MPDDHPPELQGLSREAWEGPISTLGMSASITCETWLSSAFCRTMASRASIFPTCSMRSKLCSPRRPEQMGPGAAWLCLPSREVMPLAFRGKTLRRTGSTTRTSTPGNCICVEMLALYKRAFAHMRSPAARLCWASSHRLHPQQWRCAALQFQGHSLQCENSTGLTDEWVEVSASVYAAAIHVLRSLRPGLPQMLDTLSRTAVMEFSCATKRPPVPRPDEAEQCQLVVRYMQRLPWTSAEWLRAYRTGADAPHRYRRLRGQRVALKIFWAPLSSD